MERNHYPDGLTESAIDVLLEEVDRELATEERAVTVRVSHDFTDSRRAWRAARRASRTALRSLPVRADVTDLRDGEAA